MVKKIKAVEKVIAKAALTTAKSNVNSVCNFFFYQSKIPEKAKKLRKFKDERGYAEFNIQAGIR